jgi:hypothetical protein
MPSSSAAAHASLDAPIAVGDFVRWNNRYEGRVVAVNCETAAVIEKNNFALGHAVKWRIRLDALTKIVIRAERC